MSRASAAAGIYVHIPFCGGKCAYCDFYSVPVRDASMAPSAAGAMQAYVRGLLRQFRQYTPEKHPETAGLSFDTVYFGGGTPSILGAQHLCRLLEGLRAAFPLSAGAEITLEANPGELCLVPADDGREGARALAALRETGFNRLSLGLQSALDDELRLLGRRHSFAQARQAVRAAREAGFDNLSLDLIYGLPGQSPARWRESVEAVCALEPEHVSAYALSLSAGVPLYARKDELPDDDTQLAMYLSLIERLARGGWAQYEISNFARPGRRSRHNMKYWTGAPFLGFGPGAHSYTGGVRRAWAADTAAYLRGLEEGGPAFAREEPVGARDAAEEYLMLRLRMAEGLDSAEFIKRFGLDFAPFAAVLQKYLPHGLVLQENCRWALTPRGMFVSNGIISELFAVLDEIPQALSGGEGQ